MEKSMMHHHIDMSLSKSFKMLDELYDIPVERWDDCETDMLKDIWESIDHMCSVKQKMQ